MLSLRKIPIKNIKAHPVRTILLMILTFAQAVCVFSGILMMLEMRQELSAAEARLGADILVYPTAAVSKINKNTLLMQGTPVEVYKDRSMLSRMDSCEGIAAVSYQIYLSDTLADGSRIWIIGYDPETDFAISPWVDNGGSVSVPQGSVLVGSSVELSESQTVSLYQKEWPAAAKLTETGSLMDAAVFAPLDTLKEMIRAAEEAGIDSYSSVYPESDFSVALVRVSDRAQVESVTDWINIYVRKVTAVRSEETLTQAASDIRGTTNTMLVIAVIAWLVLLFALAVVQSMLMKERIRELYVWHSIGASRGIVNRVMLSEALMIHLIGAAAGVLLTGIVFFLFGIRVFSAGMLPVGNVLAAALLSVLITAAAGVVSAWIAVKGAAKKLSGQMLLTV